MRRRPEDFVGQTTRREPGLPGPAARRLRLDVSSPRGRAARCGPAQISVLHRVQELGPATGFRKRDGRMNRGCRICADPPDPPPGPRSSPPRPLPRAAARSSAPPPAPAGNHRRERSLASSPTGSPRPAPGASTAPEAGVRAAPPRTTDPGIRTGSGPPAGSASSGNPTARGYPPGNCSPRTGSRRTR